MKLSINIYTIKLLLRIFLCNCMLVMAKLKMNPTEYYPISWISLFEEGFYDSQGLPVAIIDDGDGAVLDINLPVVMSKIEHSILIYSVDLNITSPKASFLILGGNSVDSVSEHIEIVDKLFYGHWSKVVFWFLEPISSHMEDFIVSQSFQHSISSLVILSPKNYKHHYRMITTNNLIDINHPFKNYTINNNNKAIRDVIKRVLRDSQRFDNDFRGAVLRVKAHPKYLMLQYGNGTGLFGVDASALYTLARMLNFKVRLVMGIKNYFGNTFPNGSLTTSITDLMAHKVDMNINRHVVFVRPEVVMLPALDHEDFCFILPYFRGQYKVTSLLLIFTTKAWTALFLSLITSGAVWRLFNQICKTDDYPEMSLLQSLLSNKVFKVQKLFQTIFIVSWLTFVLILVSASKVIMLKHLLTPIWVDEITNMEELLQSNLKIKNRIGIFQVAQTNSTLEKLLNRSVVSHLVESDDEFRTSAYFTSKYFRFFLDTALGGSDHYYKIPDCLSDFYVSYIVAARSPYFIGLQQKILYLQQHGLYIMWFKQFNNRSNLIRKGESSFYFGNSTKNEKNRFLTMKDLMLAFYIHVLGLFISIVVFLCEVLSSRTFGNGIIKPFIK